MVASRKSLHTMASLKSESGIPKWIEKDPEMSQCPGTKISVTLNRAERRLCNVMLLFVSVGYGVITRRLKSSQNWVVCEK